MGYFNKLDNKDVKLDDFLIKLTSLITLDDVEVLKNLKNRISDPKSYLKNNKDDLEIYWINDESTDDEIKEIAFIESLKEGDYLFSFDWGVSLNGIVSQLEKSKLVKEYNLNLDSEFINENDLAGDIFEQLDENWREDGFTLAGFNINNDSYEVFICKEDNFEKIIETTNLLETETKRAKDL